jgi:hypothetical protein
MEHKAYSDVVVCAEHTAYFEGEIAADTAVAEV